MPKREFVQLAGEYSESVHVNRWYISDKLDGMRAFWDGGISRGILSKDVPWANVEKDKKDVVATGLWSRLGKVVWAPDWWLDRLPQMPLDGELFIEPQKFQQLMRICRSQSGSDWTDVKYMVFDSPPLDVIFSDGVIEVRVGREKYSRTLSGVMNWVESNKKRKVTTIKKGTDFETLLAYWKKNPIDNDVVQVLEQVRLPMRSDEIADSIESRFRDAIDRRMEGVIIRAHHESWRPQRAKYMLKYKPSTDDEGIVAGYVWGFGKHEGRMGAMLVQWQDKRSNITVMFELSGFTDQERYLVNDNNTNETPGKVVDDSVINPMFTRGSVVTFTYRELSESGIPREGRFLRKRNEI